MGSNINKLIKFSLIVLCTSFMACDRYAELSEFKVEYDLVLKNESGYDIKIFAYYKNEKYDEIELKNKQKILKRVSYLPREVSKYNTNNIFKYTVIGAGEGDSSVIVFDNKKMIIQACNGKPFFSCKDIIKNINYIFPNGIRKGRTRSYFFEEISDLREYSITLTKEDYERATPIKN